MYKIPGDIDNATVLEVFGHWNINDRPRLTDLRSTAIVSRRRRNLRHCPLQASYVVVNNDSFNHMSDHM